jgi:hypothetical protein
MRIQVKAKQEKFSPSLVGVKNHSIFEMFRHWQYIDSFCPIQKKVYAWNNENISQITKQLNQ